MTIQTKTNASTAKTRRRLHQAFLTLAETNEVSGISVNQVTHQAGLNRSTFYLHYPDIASLIEAVFSEVIEELDLGGKLFSDGIPMDDAAWRETYFRRIGEQPELFHRLLADPGAPSFASRVIAMHEARILATWESLGIREPENEPDLAFRARFAATGILGVTMYWLESGMEESPETICAWTFRLAMHTADLLDD